MALKLNVVTTAPSMIISWNVDGYRDCMHTWLTRFLQQYHPDVVFISETKKPVDYLTALFSQFTDYNYILNVHNPTRWHGVAMLIHKSHSYTEVPINMNIPPRSDNKSNDAGAGRVIAIHLDQQLYVIGSYTPNSGRGRDKLAYRTQVWDQAFTTVLQDLSERGPTMWVGDINVAPETIDMSNPKTMKNWAGCSPEEQANFRKLIQTGNWIDIWRQQNPGKPCYTWRGYTPRANYGLRLDNIIVSKSLLPRVMNAFLIEDNLIGSDHLPVGVYVRV